MKSIISSSLWPRNPEKHQKDKFSETIVLKNTNVKNQKNIVFTNFSVKKYKKYC